MRRIFGFILKLAIVIGLAVWLADRPGTARIVWHDYVIETSAAFLGLTAFTIGFVFYLLFRFWHLIKHGPEQWRMSRKLRQMRQGQDQLTAGLVAIAGGHAIEAGRLAVGARKLLGTTAATQLLQAQAAQLVGDHKTAQAIFRALTADPEGAVLGYRGLIMEARREGQWTEVDRLVQEWRQKKPDTPWLSLIQFEIAARQQKWGEADIALTQTTAAQLLDTARSKRYRAAILVARSQTEVRQNHTEQALQTAEQAAKLAPGWIPAVINLAQRQMSAGHKKAAHRTIERNWQQTSHPQLAAAYRAGNADPLDAFKQVEKLCRHNETDPTSRMVLAEAALAADIWGEARRHLLAVIGNGNATQAAYRMMARLERRESGDEQAALRWLTKAIDAPLDPVWLCQSCGGTHEDWQATCKHCGHFNTLEWQSPGVSHASNGERPLLLGTWND